MENKQLKPFSMGYVLRTTARHIRKSIDISIRKTFDRTAEFREGGPTPSQEKSLEIFETLSKLHELRKILDDFQVKYSNNFKGE